MNKGTTIYRLYDDNEEKHYLISLLNHEELEKLAEQFRTEQKEIIAKDFINFVKKHDEEAGEIQVQDLYF